MVSSFMTKTNRKILLLGIGSAQVDAIRCARQLGCEVFAVAEDFDGPGLKYAHHFEQIDIIDIDNVLRYAQEIACDAGYSVGSDTAMPTIGDVC